MFFKTSNTPYLLIHPTQLIVLETKHDFNRLVRFLQDLLSDLDNPVKTGRLKETTAKAIGANSAAHLLSVLPALVDGGSLLDWIEEGLGNLKLPEPYDHLHDFASLYSFGYRYAKAAVFLRESAHQIRWFGNNPETITPSDWAVAMQSCGWPGFLGINVNMKAILQSDDLSPEELNEHLIQVPESSHDRQITEELSFLIFQHWSMDEFDFKSMNS